MRRAAAAVSSFCFEPHWHTGGRLRLDGAPAGRGEPVRDDCARGEAVIYLYDEVAVEQALAHHGERNPGLQCGFVFLDLSRQLGEPWTVSLSHEALDLIADPAVNLLVAGPHPSAPEREVFFWRQVCDSVQGEQYEVDGVAVCDFVLPRYFARAGADGARCDFTGARDRAGAALSPFGLAAGGCAGFYDPGIGDHDVAVADERAEKRRQLEAGAGLARRAQSYQRHQARPSQGPGDVRLEAFAIQASASDDPEAAVRRAADRVLGPSWQVRRLLRDSLTFEASHPTVTLDPADAWDRAYEIARGEHIASAEPLFEVRMREGEAEATIGPRAERLALAPAARDLSASSDVEWAIKMIDAPEAWGMFGPTGRLPGEGITIGHPDTGYTRHPEIWPGRIRLEGAYDFFTDDGDPTDELLEGGMFATPGHGTATSSVIVSEWGAQRPASGPYVTGVAPKAAVVPFRVMKSPVLWSTRNVTSAIDRAAAVGCHVISIRDRRRAGPVPAGGVRPRPARRHPAGRPAVRTLRRDRARPDDDRGRHAGSDPQPGRGRDRGDRAPRRSGRGRGPRRAVRQAGRHPRRHRGLDRGGGHAPRRRSVGGVRDRSGRAPGSRRLAHRGDLAARALIRRGAPTAPGPGPSGRGGGPR